MSQSWTEKELQQYVAAVVQNPCRPLTEGGPPKKKERAKRYAKLTERMLTYLHFIWDFQFDFERLANCIQMLPLQDWKVVEVDSSGLEMPDDIKAGRPGGPGCSSRRAVYGDVIEPPKSS